MSQALIGKETAPNRGGRKVLWGTLTLPSAAQWQRELAANFDLPIAITEQSPTNFPSCPHSPDLPRHPNSTSSPSTETSPNSSIEQDHRCAFKTALAHRLRRRPYLSHPSSVRHRNRTGIASSLFRRRHPPRHSPPRQPWPPAPPAPTRPPRPLSSSSRLRARATRSTPSRCPRRPPCWT